MTWPVGCYPVPWSRPTAPGTLARAVLAQRAHEVGKELGTTAHATASGADTRDTALRVLRAHGYEPRTEDRGISL
jgi:hypothetical protein